MNAAMVRKSNNRRDGADERMRTGASSPSPLVGEGRGGGSGGYGSAVPHSSTPTPDPSPQGEGEKRRHARPRLPFSSGEGGGGRIAKGLARAGLCSRRQAEEWIAAGRGARHSGTISSPPRNRTARGPPTGAGQPPPRGRGTPGVP